MTRGSSDRAEDASAQNAENLSASGGQRRDARDQSIVAASIDPAAVASRSGQLTSMGPRAAIEFDDTGQSAVTGVTRWAAGRGTRTVGWRPWLFIIMVAVPTLLASVYYGLLAADQYVTEFRFNLRAATNAAMPVSGASGFAAGLAGLNPTAVWDSSAIVQFIKSREIVDRLQDKIDLRRIYSNPAADFLTRIEPGEPIEDVVDYWRHMVNPFFDLTTGVITVTVRAFTPADARLVGQAVLQLSEQQVNDLSARSREDALQFAKAEVTQAELDLQDAELAVRNFRDQHGILDPAHLAGLGENLQGKLQEQLASLQVQYLSLSKSSASSPALPVLRSKINALQSVLTSARAEQTQSGTNEMQRVKSEEAMPAVLAKYENLMVKEATREKAYAYAQQSLQAAMGDANRQQLYLNAFVTPSEPQESRYPLRIRSVLLVFGVGTVAWALCCLAVYAVQDHI